MRNSKNLKGIVSQSSYRVYIIAMLFALVFQSCSKNNDPELVTYTGQIWLYDGPEIGTYEEIDKSYLKPFPGIEVSIAACKPFAGIVGNGCTPNYDVEELDVTDVEGKYSISFTAHSDISYYPKIEYHREYIKKSEGYSPNPYKEIILVPRSLIK